MLKIAIFLAICRIGLTSGQTCKEEGFFRNPDNCKKFYRCVDLWQNGRELTIYHFKCPPGTVFDEEVSVCNWPQLAAPCGEAGTEESEEDLASTEGPQPGAGESGADGESVILKPSFSFQCTGEGLFEHATDCSKFWVCDPEEDNEFESQLYICPDNYWVSKSMGIKVCQDDQAV